MNLNVPSEISLEGKADDLTYFRISDLYIQAHLRVPGAVPVRSAVCIAVCDTSMLVVRDEHI